MQCSQAPSSPGTTARAELGRTLARMGGRVTEVHLHSGRAEVVHDGHEARQDCGVLLVLQLRAQIRAHLPDGLTRRPSHMRAPVLQPLHRRAAPPAPSSATTAPHRGPTEAHPWLTCGEHGCREITRLDAVQPPAHRRVILTLRRHIAAASLIVEIPGNFIAAQCSDTTAWLRRDRVARRCEGVFPKP